jgi:cell division protein FtsQ
MRFVTAPKARTNPTPTSRAEEARRRRVQDSQKRVKTTASRLVSPTKTRPATVVRGSSLFGKSIFQQTGNKRARRQFYLTMDQHGSELRLPALPAINFGWRLLSGLLSALILFGIVSFWTSPYFQITSVEVSGLQRISPEELTSTLQMEYLSIVQVDPETLLQTIQLAYPELVDIQIKIEMPNYVSISAVERQPVMAWIKGDQLTWVDGEGILFPSRGDAGPLVTIESEDDIPLAPLPIEKLAMIAQTAEAESTAEAPAKTGLFSSAVKVAGKVEPTLTVEPLKADPVLLAAAQALSHQLPADTLLVYQKDHGLGWTDSQGWQVYIGRDLDQYEAKYSLYQTIIGYLAEQGIKPAMVSVENLNEPFYRLEQ